MDGAGGSQDGIAGDSRVRAGTIGQIRESTSESNRVDHGLRHGLGALVCRCLKLAVARLIDQMASDVYRVTHCPACLLLNKAAVTKRYRHSPASVGVRVVCKRSAAEHPSKAAQILIELVSLLVL